MGELLLMLLTNTWNHFDLYVTVHVSVPILPAEKIVTQLKTE